MEDKVIMVHVIPNEFNRDGYQDIYICKECGFAGVCADLSEYSPCFNCGGKVVEFGVARWVKPKWGLRFMFIPWKVSNGYWEPKEDIITLEDQINKDPLAQEINNL